MNNNISPLEKELAKMPIELPSNPFWEVFKRFGRDEMISMVINVAGTAGISYFLNANLDKNTRNVILSVSGPIIEKIGFFPAHFKEAHDLYKTTPKKEREPMLKYFKKAVKNGSVSLAEDVLVHDPMYVTMMYTGMQLYPQTPAWLLSGASFIAAVFAVAGLEVCLTEARYLNFKRNLKNIGFDKESYFESRFYIDERKNTHDILEAMASEFKLPTMQTAEYNDVYLKTKLPAYSGRKPKLRLRKRIIEDEEPIRSAQIIYTTTSELAKKEASQFRFFPQRKDKFYFLLEQQMPESIDEIKEPKAREYLQKINDGTFSENVHFSRVIARDNDGLLVAADKLHFSGERPFNVIELKVRTDKKLMKEAMRYVMLEFPCMQITYGKSELVAMSRNY